ncbi:MAG: hypothetical protein LUE61_05990, partial [Clostridiales bacterium]|nr:hypothetical protein [Clostridiales bacterium]
LGGAVMLKRARGGRGGGGGSGCQALLRAASAGITAAGGDVFLHDGTTALAAAWFARSAAVPVSLFLEQRGEDVRLHCLDGDGLPFSRARQRRLE